MIDLSKFMQPIYTNLEGRFLSNTSITLYRDRLAVAFRSIDYCLWTESDLKLCLLNGREVLSKIHVGLVEPEKLPVVETHELEQDSPYAYTINNTSYKGREDMVLVTWNDKLYGYSSRPDLEEGKIVMELIEFDNDLNIGRSWTIRTDATCEKNWMAIEDKPFTWIYWNSPLQILTFDPDQDLATIEQISDTDELGGYKGSTNILKIKAGYLGIVHYGTFPQYNHAFVVYDSDLNVIKTVPFKFTNHKISFVKGFTRQDDTFYLTVTVDDTAPMLIKLSKYDLDKILQGLQPDSYVSTEWSLSKFLYNRQYELAFSYAKLYDRRDIQAIIQIIKNILRLTSDFSLEMLEYLLSHLPESADKYYLMSKGYPERAAEFLSKASYLGPVSGLVRYVEHN